MQIAIVMLLVNNRTARVPSLVTFVCSCTRRLGMGLLAKMIYTCSNTFFFIFSIFLYAVWEACL